MEIIIHQCTEDHYKPVAGEGNTGNGVKIAITGTQKGLTVWLEPVTDEEYNNVTKQ